MKKYTYTTNFIENEYDFLLENVMGPNAIRVAEELTSYLDIKPSMRILDLGCGTGLSSIFLAEKYDATVYASDLWISPSDNFKRFDGRGLANKIIPLSIDATKEFPFAGEYFDIIHSVDAYHYFGTSDEMLPFLLSFVKKGGYIIVAVPGLQQEQAFENGTPAELTPYLPDGHNFHSVEWWTKHWEKCPDIELINCQDMESHEQAWKEWLASSNPHAINDVKMMEVEDNKYFNFVQLIAKKK